jgi:hypothetical protein
VSGFAVLYREATEHHLFVGDSSRFGAWAWLVLKACWKPTKFSVSGSTITVERGQLCVSRSQLATAWGWSPSAVERFLTRLQTEQMIGRATGQGRSIITICNYDKYQDIGEQAGQAPEQPAGQRPDSDRTTKEQGNHGTIEDEEANASPSSARAKADKFPLPDGVDPIDWEALKANRKAKRAALSEGAHRQIINKLERWARDGWPPGPIVANAAERGWTSVFETDEMKAAPNGRNGNNRSHAPGNHGGRDNRDGFERAIDRNREARLEAERRSAGGDGGGRELAAAQHPIL